MHAGTFKSSVQATGYVPAIPMMVTNFGAAAWTVETDDAGLRVYARRWPPWWVLLIAGAVTCIGISPIVFGFTFPTAMNGNAKTVAAAAIAPVALGLFGVWGAVLGGNLAEASKGDLVRCDAATKTVALPRRRLDIPCSDVLRVELVSFGLRGGYNTAWCHDLVLAWRDGQGREAFEHLLRNAGGMSDVGSELAKYLNVAFVKASAGVFDWTTKCRLS